MNSSANLNTMADVNLVCNHNFFIDVNLATNSTLLPNSNSRLNDCKGLNVRVVADCQSADIAQWVDGGL